MTLGIPIISMLLPWWASIIWIIGICIWLHISMRFAWWISGMSLAVVWFLASIFFKSHDQTDLIGKTGALLGGVSGFLLVVITTVIGFITGALSGWFGSACATIIHKSNQRLINGYKQSGNI